MLPIGALLKRWPPPLAGALSLLGAGLMIGSLFPPYVAAQCPDCVPGAFSSSKNVMSGYDGWLVDALAVVLGLLALAFLVGVGRRLISTCSLILSVPALGLAIFDGVDAEGRVLRGDQPALLGGSARLTATVALDAGFYLLLIGAVVAVVAAIGMVSSSAAAEAGPTQGGETRRRASRGAAGLGLAASAMMFAGLFATFASAPFKTAQAILPVTHSSLPVLVASFSSLRIGPDGGAALAMVIATATGCALVLTGVRPHAASLAVAVCSLTGIGFAGFEAANAPSRLLQSNPAFGPAELGSGFYLFICGAGLAAVVALAMIYLSLRGRPRLAVVAAPALPAAGPT